jgi:hypothetical protein
MVAEKEACWSFNMDGQRCEEKAGHDGRHAVSVTWTDEEAWTPAKGPLGAPRASQSLLEAVQPVLGVPYDVADDLDTDLGPGVEVVPEATCANCDHAYHSGEPCVRLVGRGQIECGCTFAG